MLDASANYIIHSDFVTFSSILYMYMIKDFQKPFPAIKRPSKDRCTCYHRTSTKCSTNLSCTSPACRAVPGKLFISREKTYSRPSRPVK